MTRIQHLLLQVRHEPFLLRIPHQIRPTDPIPRLPHIQQRHLDHPPILPTLPFLLTQRPLLLQHRIVRQTVIIADRPLEPIPTHPLHEPPLLRLPVRVWFRLYGEVSVPPRLREVGSHRAGDAEHLAHPDIPLFSPGFVLRRVEAVVDVPEALEVLAHDVGRVRGGEEFPVGPLRVAEALGGEGVGGGEGEWGRGGDLVGEGEQDEALAQVPVVEVEALGGGGAPVVADGDDAGAVGGGLREGEGVEDLGERGGLLFVVVEGGVGGFGAAGEAEEVGDDEWVAACKEGGRHAGPHVCVVWEAVEEEQDGERGVLDLGVEGGGEVVAVG